MITLTWADYFIIGIVGFSVIVSLIRGFVREALSLTSWIAAFWVAFKYSAPLAELLIGLMPNSSLRFPAAIGILFVATLIIGAIVNYVITQVVERTGLSGTDRVLGMGFGFARGVLLVSVLLLVASLTPIPKSKEWQASLLVPYFQPLQNWLAGFLPHSVDTHLVNSN